MRRLRLGGLGSEVEELESEEEEEGRSGGAWVLRKAMDLPSGEKTGWEVEPAKLGMERSWGLGVVGGWAKDWSGM